jgi:hypothetical protein
MVFLTPPDSLLLAQQSNTLYLMHEVPQSNLLNPAVQIACRYYIGIPFLTTVHVSYSNTAFTYNDLAGSGTWNTEGVFRQMHRRDLYSVEALLAPVSLGYRHRSLYFTFNIIERAFGYQTVPRDLAELAVYGNWPLVGERANFNGLRTGGVHMREYSLGISRVAGPYLTAGIRAKLLFGKANLATGRARLGMSTAEDNFGLNVDFDYTLNSSFPVTLTTDADGNIEEITLDEIDPAGYILNRGNPGFALDLGAIYRYTDRVTFSASLLDLGLIRWKTDLNNVRGQGAYAYVGQNLVAEFLTETYVQEVIDSITAQVEVTTAQEPYTYYIPAQLFLAGSYRYSDRVAFGLVNRNVIFTSKVHSSFTLSARADLAERFLGTLSWSYLNNSILNVGVGLAYHGKGFQIHAVTDNLLGFFFPFDTRTLNLRLGMNLMLGCPRNKRERLQEASYGKLPGSGICPYAEKPGKEKKKREKAVRKLNR